MYRYWLRIYTRFALSSDRMITGKFEIGGPHRQPSYQNPEGMTDVGRVSSLQKHPKP